METTRDTATHFVRLLPEYPEQRALLMSYLDRYLPSAISVLRFWPPVIEFRRMAAKDMELSGHQIKKGDRIYFFMPQPIMIPPCSKIPTASTLRAKMPASIFPSASASMPGAQRRTAPSCALSISILSALPLRWDRSAVRPEDWAAMTAAVDTKAVTGNMPVMVLLRVDGQARTFSARLLTATNSEIAQLRTGTLFDICLRDALR